MSRSRARILAPLPFPLAALPLTPLPPSSPSMMPAPLSHHLSPPPTSLSPSRCLPSPSLSLPSQPHDLSPLPPSLFPPPAHCPHPPSLSHPHRALPASRPSPLFVASSDTSPALTSSPASTTPALTAPALTTLAPFFSLPPARHSSPSLSLPSSSPPPPSSTSRPCDSIPPPLTTADVPCPLSLLPTSPILPFVSSADDSSPGSALPGTLPLSPSLFPSSS